MEKDQGPLEELFIKTEEYAKTTLELSKLKMLENVSDVSSSASAIVVSAIIFILALLMATTGLSIYVGQLLGAIYLGFFAVAGGYVLIGIFFYFFLQNTVKKRVSSSLNKKLFN